MNYNKKQFQKVNDKKILHKVKKLWVTISVALLGVIGGSALVTNINANADNTENNNQNDNIKHEINNNLKQHYQNQLVNNSHLQQSTSDASTSNTNITSQSIIQHASQLHNKMLLGSLNKVHKQSNHSNHNDYSKITYWANRPTQAHNANLNSLKTTNKLGYIHTNKVYNYHNMKVGRINVPFNQVKISKQLLLHKNIEFNDTPSKALNRGTIVHILRAYEIYGQDGNYYRYLINHHTRKYFITGNVNYNSLVLPHNYKSYRNNIKKLVNNAISHSNKRNRKQIRNDLKQLTYKHRTNYKAYLSLYHKVFKNINKPTYVLRNTNKVARVSSLSNSGISPSASSKSLNYAPSMSYTAPLATNNQWVMPSNNSSASNNEWTSMNESMSTSISEASANSASESMNKSYSQSTSNIPINNHSNDVPSSVSSSKTLPSSKASIASKSTSVTPKSISESTKPSSASSKSVIPSSNTKSSNSFSSANSESSSTASSASSKSVVPSSNANNSSISSSTSIISSSSSLSYSGSTHISPLYLHDISDVINSTKQEISSLENNTADKGDIELISKLENDENTLNSYYRDVSNDTNNESLADSYDNQAESISDNNDPIISDLDNFEESMSYTNSDINSNLSNIQELQNSTYDNSSLFNKAMGSYATNVEDSIESLKTNLSNINESYYHTNQDTSQDSREMYDDMSKASDISSSYANSYYSYQTAENYMSDIASTATNANFSYIPNNYSLRSHANHDMSIINNAESAVNSDIANIKPLSNINMNMIQSASDDVENISNNSDVITSVISCNSYSQEYSTFMHSMYNNHNISMYLATDPTTNAKLVSGSNAFTSLVNSDNNIMNRMTSKPTNSDYTNVHRDFYKANDINQSVENSFSDSIHYRKNIAPTILNSYKLLDETNNNNAYIAFSDDNLSPWAESPSDYSDKVTSGTSINSAILRHIINTDITYYQKYLSNTDIKKLLDYKSRANNDINSIDNVYNSIKANYMEANSDNTNKLSDLTNDLMSICTNVKSIKPLVLNNINHLENNEKQIISDEFRANELENGMNNQSKLGHKGDANVNKQLKSDINTVSSYDNTQSSPTDNEVASMNSSVNNATNLISSTPSAQITPNLEDVKKNLISDINTDTKKPVYESSFYDNLVNKINTSISGGYKLPARSIWKLDKKGFYCDLNNNKKDWLEQLEIKYHLIKLGGLTDNDQRPMALIPYFTGSYDDNSAYRKNNVGEGSLITPKDPDYIGMHTNIILLHQLNYMPSALNKTNTDNGTINEFASDIEDGNQSALDRDIADYIYNNINSYVNTSLNKDGHAIGISLQQAGNGMINVKFAEGPGDGHSIKYSDRIKGIHSRPATGLSNLSKEMLYYFLSKETNADVDSSKTPNINVCNPSDEPKSLRTLISEMNTSSTSNMGVVDYTTLIMKTAMYNASPLRDSDGNALHVDIHGGSLLQGITSIYPYIVVSDRAKNKDVYIIPYQSPKNYMNKDTDVIRATKSEDTFIPSQKVQYYHELSSELNGISMFNPKYAEVKMKLSKFINTEKSKLQGDYDNLNGKDYVITQNNTSDNGDANSDD